MKGVEHCLSDTLCTIKARGRMEGGTGVVSLVSLPSEYSQKYLPELLFPVCSKLFHQINTFTLELRANLRRMKLRGATKYWIIKKQHVKSWSLSVLLYFTNQQQPLIKQQVFNLIIWEQRGDCSMSQDFSRMADNAVIC